MSSERHEFHLSITSRFENIDLVQTVLNDTLEALGVEEGGRHWIDLAVREAVANAIKHGNAQDPDKRVRVDFAVDGDDAVIRVRDEGGGFNPEMVADPLDASKKLSPGGRGLLYMQRLMDQVTHLEHPDGGTEVVLRKRITPAENHTVRT
ncbi:MAG: ATP-binding protein [Acidobacteria bacterium]|nr:ATP-binding protein [Acidobacteriota bacterium]